MKLKGLVRKCLECGKEFEPHRHNHVYCSPSCQNKYNSKKRKEERLRNRRKPNCLWCHKTSSEPCAKYCSPECMNNFKVVRTRLFNIIPFDHRHLHEELVKLRQLGKDYRFPKDFDDFNSGYYFKELVEHESE